MVRFRVRFQFLWMIEEGEREEQGDLSVALVLWAQNRRFRGVWDLWVRAFNGGIGGKEHGAAGRRGASSRFNISQGA